MTCQGVGVPFYGDPFLRPWVPEEIINKIIGVPPPHPSSSPDRIIWGATSTGSFSLKSAYEKGLSCGVSGRIGTCSFSKISLFQGFHLIK
ncbi:hypothetical protein Gotri_017273 [Gossypium trilobum]|uniref:Uncharacterized protein n=1 Tax=Gossypium trilobum TaxID=34281 RepID=A0A7J9E6S7_9ROSI|nr:hypothetical protein [Gossypium trilobum]